tara:strand:- start:122 stop:325 length:204 start_codon:yes stop_codon:yes gene_type:complete
MKIELDLKTLITLGGIIAMLSGFVYTTSLRLEMVESRLERVENEQTTLKKRYSHSKKGKKASKETTK